MWYSECEKSRNKTLKIHPSITTFVPRWCVCNLCKYITAGCKIAWLQRRIRHVKVDRRKARLPSCPEIIGFLRTALLLPQKTRLILGPVHTYPDIFESATFSFRIRKYLRPHVMWSQRIHIEFARPHVFGFTPDSLGIDKIVPLGTGSSRSNPQSSRTALLSYSFKLFLPAVLTGR